MNTQRQFAFLSVIVLAGCTADPSVSDDIDLPNPPVSAALTSFDIDAKALSQVPKSDLPPSYLTLEKLADDNIARSLLQTTEAFQRTYAPGTLRMFKSSSWNVEADAVTGRVSAMSTAHPGKAVPLADDALQKESLARLATLGIGEGEIGRVLQRRAMMQHDDALGRPELHCHKTFVFRGIHGTEVVGHRAVISHGVDGVVRKVNLKWPALAKTGHSLHTPLTVKDIETRASEALAREGEHTGKARLFWRYLPEPTPTGEVTLKLAVGAWLDGTAGKDGTAEEPRVIDVDVSATP